ncbi:hypothetical protein [Haliscomenobacter sp.]|uniref:hypothetical protein n=1 Tax=Haliscomenobacter sp. TaxID=2717303 RepID=UPI003593C479
MISNPILSIKRKPMTLNGETVAAVFEQQQSINAKRAQIKQLEKDIELLSNNITTYLWKEIADWQPYQDEMSVCYYPESCSAIYVWYVEPFGECHRFKETPTYELTIRNYYRQEKAPQKGGEFIVVPLRTFEHLNRELRIDVYNKFEVISRP